MNVKKVKTEADLRLYLTRKWWDCLVIDDGMNLNEPVIIQRDVKLVCSRNGAVFSLHTDYGNDHSLFQVNGCQVEFEAMKIKMIPNMAGNSSAIKFNTPFYCVVSDCEIKGFSWGGIWQFDCEKLTVHSNDIEGDGGASYNYAVWQGGKGDAYDQELYFIDNYVKNVRHAIGASYHPNSYYAIGNTISTLTHSFDRHNWNSGGRKGGLHTVISGNTFLNPDRLAFSVEPPYEGGSFVFTGNSLNHSESRHVGEIGEVRVYEGPMAPNTSIHSNKFIS